MVITSMSEEELRISKIENIDIDKYVKTKKL